MTKVIFYCGMYFSCPYLRNERCLCDVGSSTGRGPRCAGWMQDYIDDIAKFGKKSNIEVAVLKGGIKGWVKEFEGMLMDGFEEGKWEELK